jgi:hypothetical protein
MIVEIRQAETEALIEQRMASGAFHDIEAVLLYALRTAPPPPPSAAASHDVSMNLVEVCALEASIAHRAFATR